MEERDAQFGAAIVEKLFHPNIKAPGALGADRRDVELRYLLQTSGSRGKERKQGKVLVADAGLFDALSVVEFQFSPTPKTIFPPTHEIITHPHPRIHVLPQ